MRKFVLLFIFANFLAAQPSQQSIANYQANGFYWVEHLFQQHRFDELELLIQKYPHILFEAILRHNYSLVQHISRNLPAVSFTLQNSDAGEYETPLGLAVRLGNQQMIDILSSNWGKR